MDFSGWLGQARDVSGSLFSQATGALGAGANFVTATLGNVSLLGSTETSKDYDAEQVDEKHYFLVPDRRCPAGYSLYSMRCLPVGVPPVNDLPKRRLFHLPSDSAMPTVEQILLEEARDAAAGQPATELSLGRRLNAIADQIDQLDERVFNGVLLIGGLVALINPLAGAAVAVKALLPSAALMLSKYGIQYAGDAANAREVAGRVKTAQKDVLRQFHGSGADSMVNPLLAQLDRALETTAEQFEPIMEFDADELSFGDQDRGRLFSLTCQAISNTYEALLQTPSEWERAQLGPEDVRFLKLISQLANPAADAS